ncbi:hypothetical protein C0992_000076 [Termitomyces sp. T32_za158]|nr:hypothetical protein C0992_000076 [Termitomyces sp. T32_za158]
MLVPGGVGFASPFLGGRTSIAFWTKDDLPKLTRATFIGILIAVSGNVLISLALNLQKLAHRRIEAGYQVKHPGTANANGARRRRSDSLRLDEHDEDVTQTTSLLDLSSPEIRPTEAGPLLPLPHTPGYGSAAHGPNGGVVNRDRSRSVSSQVVPAWRKSGRPPSDASLNGAMAVDVVSEETALLRQNSKSQRQNMVEDGHETAYLKSKLWWVGFILMNVGETGNFISYAWAPASVVAPLGTRDLVGIAIAIIGAVTVVLATNASNTQLDPDTLLEAISQTPFIIYSCVYLVGAVILGVLSHSDVGRQWVFIDVGLCALFGALYPYPVM